MILHLDFSDEVLYAELNGTYFPAEGWHDLVAADLEVWLPRLISFAMGHSDACTLPFMDGPACIKLYRQSDGGIRADCLWDQRIQSSRIIDLRELLRSAVSCLRRCNRLRYEAGECALFAPELAQISALLKQLPQ